MRPLVRTLGTVLLLAPLASSAQMLDAVAGFGGTGFSLSAAVAAGPDGASTVTGFFSGEVTFGEGPDAVTATAAGNDGFVARYDAAGALLWATRFGGNGGDAGSGVVVGRDGAVYVTGSFRGTATFGEGPDAVTLDAAGTGLFDSDGFVAKYDSAGALRWAVSFGGTDGDAGNAIALGPGGDPYVAGAFRGTATFGEGSAAVTLTNAGFGDDGFVARYRDDGTLRGAVAFGGPSFDEGNGIAVGGDGAVFVTGIFANTVTFGSGPDAVTLTGASDGFLVSYGPGGRPRWATLFGDGTAGGTTFDRGTAVAVDGGGRSYVTGFFRGDATFGEGAAAVTLTTNAFDDGFVASYDAAGALRWVTDFGASSSDSGYGIAAAENGVTVVTGRFTGRVTFGAGEAAVTLDSVFREDGFLASYDAAGALRWVTPFDSPDDAVGRGVALGADRAVRVTGDFETAVTLGEGSDAVTLPAVDGFLDTDSFVARYLDGLPPDVFDLSIAVEGDPVVLPPSGGTLTVTITAVNVGSQRRTLELWTEATLPSGAAFGPLVGPTPVTLAAGDTLTQTLVQAVPSDAPAGTYTYTALFGRFPDLVSSSASFTFEKAGAAGRGEVLTAERWSASFVSSPDERRAAGRAAPDVEPQGGRALEGVFPNPSRGTAIVSFALPEPTEARLVVLDVLGREVARLVDGFTGPGRHRLPFDGAGLPGGAYLVRLEVSDPAGGAGEAVTTQRFTLVR